MSNLTNFSPYTPSPDEGRSYQYQPIKDSPSSSYNRNFNTSGVGSSSGYQNGKPLAVEEEGGTRVNVYETSLPLSFDMEAALSYILGCVSGVLLLILEQKNDYVRFHAWQSCILGVFSLAIHFILMFISTTLYWIFFSLTVLLSFYLSYRAYTDGENLVRYHLPFVGDYASKWTNEE